MEHPTRRRSHAEPDLTREQRKAALKEMYEREIREGAHAAFDGIERARKELDQIEKQLRLALDGQPYLRIGEVRGCNAQPIFTTFAAIEHRAKLDLRSA
jgi:hypothetical protein